MLYISSIQKTKNFGSCIYIICFCPYFCTFFSLKKYFLAAVSPFILFLFCFYFVFIFDVKKENVYIIKSLINYDFKNT
jgi:hypothetical protein